MSDKNNITKFYYHSELTPFTPSRLKYLREQVKRLKGIKQPEQRTEAWYAMREERITASDFATALDQSPYQRDYTLLRKKVTKDRKFNTNSAILWGVKYEDAAILVYEHRNKTKVSEYGCIEHPHYPWLGASPDGITDDGIMVEIKCPSSREITGVIPSYYWCQVQGQLEICELDRCDFLECKLEEYSREEYLADNYEGDYFYSSLGMEKGTVIEFFKLESKSKFFVFPPLGLREKELDEWVAKERVKQEADPNVIFGAVNYWRLLQTSCIPIYRNQEWFNQTAIQKFKEFWDKVQYFRGRPLRELDAYIEKVKEENKLRRMEERNKGKEDNHHKAKKKAKLTIKKSKSKMIDMRMDDYEGVTASSSGNFIIIDGERYDVGENDIFGKKGGDKKISAGNGTDGLGFSSNVFTIEPETESFSNKRKKRVPKNKYDDVETFSRKKTTSRPDPDFDYDDMELMDSGKVNFDEIETFARGGSKKSKPQRPDPDFDYDDMELMDSGKVNFDEIETFTRKKSTSRSQCSEPDFDYDDMELMDSGKINFDKIETFGGGSTRTTRSTNKLNVPVEDLNYNNMKLMNSGKVDFDKIETFKPKRRERKKPLPVRGENVFVNKRKSRVKLRKSKNGNVFSVVKEDIVITDTTVNMSSELIDITFDDKKNESFEMTLI